MIKQDIYKFMRQNPEFCLATISDGNPRVRAMRLVEASEHGIVFSSSISSNLQKELEVNRDVEMCFHDGETQIRVRGVLSYEKRGDNVTYRLERGMAKVSEEDLSYFVSLRPEIKILVLDNYDSFAYNLVHYLRELVDGFGIVEVFRNDEIKIEDIAKYDKILLSPGPGIPDEAGILKDVIREYGATKSILGICLGCQAIAEVYGGTLINMEQVYHGVALNTLVTEKDDYLFAGLPFQFLSGRYHSWVVNSNNLPDCLTIISRDEDTGMIMGLRHKEYDVRGLQFHPESVLTVGGKQMLKNWIDK